MKTFGRLTLLGSFAAVGVGLAICVGSSAPLPPREPKSQAKKSPAEDTLTKQANRDVPPGVQPPPQPAPQLPPQLPPQPPPQPPPPQPPPRPQITYIVPPWPSGGLPGGPLVAEPYPARTQQIVPEMGKRRLEEAYEAVRRQLSGSPAPTAGGPAALNSGPPSADPGGAAPSSEPARGAPKAIVDGEGDGTLSIRIHDEDIRTVLDALGEQGNLNILASSNVKGQVSATLSGVDVESALDAILKSTGFVTKREGNLIFVGTPAEFESLEQAMDKIGTRVYRPNYVTAAELQTLIQPLVTETVGVVSVSSPAEVGVGTDDASAGGDAFAGGDVVLVRDYEAVLAQIDQLVAEVDIRPLQVAIEAMILSVKLNDSDKFGVSFELLRDKSNIKFGWGMPVDSLATVTFDKGGLKFGFLDSSLGTFLDALETVGDTNVIATPRVVVLNKHRAEIQIGEQKGYVSTTVTETSATQSVEFLDVGAQLRLRPFISSDGLIRMEVHPELSDGSVDTESGFTLPNKEVTQVTTNVMVRDGCTVVIGGLMREQLADTTTQVPLFGNLPLIGFAFRHKTETIERREVLVLITPHIVYEPETCREGDKAACEFHRRQAVFADKMSVFGKRSVGRRYLRLAQSAWAAGDRDRALRFAEMAVHFDPINRAAIDLRSDIWLGRPYGEHTLGPEQAVPVALGPLDGEIIADWLLGDLEREAVPQPAPLHPWDPGQPGPHTDIVRPRRFQ